MWIYQQQTGELRRFGVLVDVGYSGFGPGKNNPALEAQKDIGPIPRGMYSIGREFDSSREGPMVMRLTPAPDTNTYGRSGFEIHGDAKEHLGCASHG
jgi:hypothetical protein